MTHTHARARAHAQLHKADLCTLALTQVDQVINESEQGTGVSSLQEAVARLALAL